MPFSQMRLGINAAATAINANAARIAKVTQVLRVDQDEGDDDDRANLAPGSVCEDGFADARTHEAALVQDGHERAKRRGGKGNGGGKPSDLV